MAATVVAPVSRARQHRAEVADAGLHHAGALGDPDQLVVGQPDPDRAVDEATVAGTAPPRRTAASISRAVAALVAVGRPWLMIVDSSATTGPMQ